MMKRFQTYIAESTRDDIDDDTSNPYGSIEELDGGSFDGDHFAQKMSAEIELNAEDRTVIFRRVTFEIPIKGKDFASGFGESVFIEGKIIAEFIDDNPLPLKTGEGTQFHVLKDDWEIDIPNENISVTYEFSGPTEKVEGTLTWPANGTTWYRRNTPTIDTKNYPNEVVVANLTGWYPWNDCKTINENIDGSDISFYISGRRSLHFPESLAFTLKPDPE